MKHPPHLIVVGAGVAGLSAALTALSEGARVSLFSLVPVFQSPSLLAQGGINAALHPGDSPEAHFYDTVFEGHFLAHQTPVWELCHAAPDWVYRLALLGVPFVRTESGEFALRFEGGSRYPRIVFTDTTTGFSILKALSTQLLKYLDSKQLSLYEYWEFLSLLRSSQGQVAGIVALHLPTRELGVFLGDSVIFATGGLGQLYLRTSNSLLSTGAATGRLLKEGLRYANGEFIQFHPTAAPLPGGRMFLLSESIRGEGGKIWTLRQGRRWDFLEEMYPEYGNLAPRDLTARAIFQVIYDLGLGVEGEEAVYLDVTHLPEKSLERLRYTLSKYCRFTGRDPRKFPMKVSPCAHYSMGGLWVRKDHGTSEEGVFAAGEVDFLYHGANRLGGNSLLSCLFGGERAAESAFSYAEGKSQTLLSDWEKRLALLKAKEEISPLSKKLPPPAVVRQKMKEVMWTKVGIVRREEELKAALEELEKLLEVAKQRGQSEEEALEYARLEAQLRLAYVIAEGSLRRQESRGGHYRSDFPKRDDEKFLKISIAEWRGETVHWDFEEVDLTYEKPVPHVLRGRT